MEKSRTARDAAKSKTQYPPAITEGGLPAARCKTGITAAQAQFRKAVPTSSSMEVTKKAEAFGTEAAR